MDKATNIILNKLIGVLVVAGAKYSITMPNGPTFKSPDFDPPVTGKNGIGVKAALSRVHYRRGETRAYYAPFFEGKKAGDYVHIPCDRFEPPILANNISSYCLSIYGSGGVTSSLNRKENRIEILIFKDPQGLV